MVTYARKSFFLISLVGCAAGFLFCMVSGDTIEEKPVETNARAKSFIGIVEKKTEGIDDENIGREELKEFLINSLGSEHFDEASEAAGGVDRAFHSLDAGNDGSISLSEMTSFWSTLESLQTVDEVADWVRYAVQLPQYEAAFRANAITGFDLPALLEKHGKLLRTDLGIASSLHRKIFLRSINTRLLGVGKLPFSGEKLVCTLLPNCKGVELDWDMYWSDGSKSEKWSSENFVPVHMYRLKRRSVFLQDATNSLLLAPVEFSNKRGGSLRVHWDKEDIVTDTMPVIDVPKSHSPRSVFVYKAQAWNLFGPSSWTESVECPPIPSICKTTHQDQDIAIHSAGSDEVATLVPASNITNRTTNKRATNFFEGLEAGTDGTNDMKIGREELLEYIRESLGNGKHFDEDAEVETAMNRAFDNVDAGGDGVITPAEMTAFWKSADDFRTVDGVVAWLKYAAQLPQYEETFRKHSVTGYMLPRLLPSSQTIKDHLGIQSDLHVNHLYDMLKVRLLGLVDVPKAIPLLQCSTQCTRYKVVWSSTGVEDRFPPHTYQVNHKFESCLEWKNHILDIGTREFSLKINPFDENYDSPLQLRIRVWSSIGSSPWTQVSCGNPSAECAQSAKPLPNTKHRMDSDWWDIVWVMIESLSPSTAAYLEEHYFLKTLLLFLLASIFLSGIPLCFKWFYRRGNALTGSNDSIPDTPTSKVVEPSIVRRRSSHSSDIVQTRPPLAGSIGKSSGCMVPDCKKNLKPKNLRGHLRNFRSAIGLKTQFHSCQWPTCPTRPLKFCKHHGYTVRDTMKHGLNCDTLNQIDCCLCYACVDELVRAWDEEGTECTHVHVIDRFNQLRNARSEDDNDQ